MEEVFPWVLAGVLIPLLLLAGFYILGLRRGLREIAEQLRDKLEGDTNTLITLSSPDGALRALASDLNVQLRALRAERLRLQNGDRELKTAVTNVSHDLRTPLTAISGYLDLLEGERVSENAARYLAVIRERTDALTALTEELFRYSVISDRSEALTLEEVSLNAALEESVAALYGAFAQRGIVPTIGLPEEPVLRTLDPAALGRVLGNILSNALKYSGGDLDIVLTEDGRFTFSNSAPGLTPVEAERLFDRFYTVSDGRGSTGLGLSIAKALTRRMGGSIGAVCRDGRFILTLDFPAHP